MNSIARAVSIIFHPAILIFFLPFLIVYRQTESTLYALKWQMFSSFFIFLAGVLVFIGEKYGIFSDPDLTRRKERSRFYAMIIILLFLYIVAIVFFKEGSSSREGFLLPVIVGFGAIFGLVLFTIVNHFFKISIHSGVTCGFAISMLILYGISAFFAVVWIVPLVIWARLVLKKHTWIEAISGGLLGGTITIVTYIIGKNYL